MSSLRMDSIENKETQKKWTKMHRIKFAPKKSYIFSLSQAALVLHDKIVIYALPNSLFDKDSQTSSLRSTRLKTETQPPNHDYLRNRHVGPAPLCKYKYIT